ncbi:MAG: hypothetical protein KME02_12665 [Aphanothece saxicola GSE-SYN-MK-01-06B]|jgi:hypothetical protein|nr:hypothetical protein [Aphanothece saxicola GSE-SYN-MK-01-06B]
MDFQFDATADGCRLKFLNVIDEHSRLFLAIRVGRRCKAKDVVAVLEELTSLYPAPAYVRSDKGLEFIAQALGTGVRPATPLARPTSSQDRRGRTALRSRSMAASGMSSSTPSCSPRLLRRRSWQIVALASTTRSGRTRPPRGVRLWGQLNRELEHDHNHPLSSDLDRWRLSRHSDSIIVAPAGPFGRGAAVLERRRVHDADHGPEQRHDLAAADQLLQHGTGAVNDDLAVR